MDELKAPVSVVIELVGSEFAPQFANVAVAVTATTKFGNLILIAIP